MRPFADILQGGDRRSIGRAYLVLAVMRRGPARFDELWACLTHADPLVRMRAADTLEKYARLHSAAFAMYRSSLLDFSLDDGTAEVRWHLISIASRLELSDQEAVAFCQALDRILRNDVSRIVKVTALQAAYDISLKRPIAVGTYQGMVSCAASSAWPSVAARAARLQRGGRRRATAASVEQSCFE